MSNKFITNKKSFLILIFTLGSLTAIGPLAIDMYLPTFSAIANYFLVDENEVQLTLSSYFIGIAIGQIFYGPIIDRFGKKPPLLFGLIIFIISSFFCIISTNINQMIIARFMQAIGACSCFVVMRAIVRDLFEPKEGAIVFSYLMLVMGVAPILAPIFGGLMLSFFGWQSIFWFLCIFGCILLLVAFFLLPESRAGDKNQFISQAFSKYKSIIADRNFLFYALSGGFAASGMFIYITGSPFVIIEFFNISPQNYGWIFAVNAFGYILFAQINARALKFFSIKDILNFVLKITLFASFLMLFFGFFWTNIWSLSIVFFIYIASIGVITPNSTALALTNQYKNSGSASALFGTLQFSIAAIIALLISKFHNNTALPMIFAMSFCGIGAFVINYYWQRKSLEKQISEAKSVL